MPTHSIMGRAGIRLRNVLLAGLLAVLPLFLTLWVLALTFRLLDGVLSPALSPVLVHLLNSWGLTALPKGARIPGLGLAGTVLLVFLAGLAVRNIVGRGLMAFVERHLLRVPLVGWVLGSAKQLLGFFSQMKGFSRTVLIEYPRDGSYALAFVTGKVDEASARALGGKGYTYVFVPSTPNPTGGILLMVPDERVFPTDFPVEAGVRLLVSAGILEESRAGKTPPKGA